MYQDNQIVDAVATAILNAKNKFEGMPLLDGEISSSLAREKYGWMARAAVTAYHEALAVEARFDAEIETMCSRLERGYEKPGWTYDTSGGWVVTNPDGHDGADLIRRLADDNRRLREALTKVVTEREISKAKTRAAIGFTHEPSGRRITVYASDKETLDALLYTPGVVEALREIHVSPTVAEAPVSGVPKRSVRDLLDGC